MAEQVEKVKIFVAEVGQEVRRVTWPTWREIAGATAVVLAATAALALLLGQHFVSSTRVPSYSYQDLYPLTVPAGGGTAGSALGRFARTMDSGGRNPNYNVIERDYCLPVYVSWMKAHPDTVTDAMWGYLERIRHTIPTIRQWPSRVDVKMEQ